MSSELAKQVNYKELAKPTLKTITERIVARFNPIKVILFGSYACGTPHEYSDLDILVVMPNGVERHYMSATIKTAIDDLPYGKDVLVTTPEDIETIGKIGGTVLYFALQDGVVLYE